MQIEKTQHSRPLGHIAGHAHTVKPDAAVEQRAVVSKLLQQELLGFSEELPSSVTPAIQQTDVDFALDTLARIGASRSGRSALRQVAAGIAWERAVAARVQQLAASNDSLFVTAQRWHPPGIPLDLDLVIRDDRKMVIWVLDAKLTQPSDEHVDGMRHQICLLKRHTGFAQAGHSVRGIIVHHRRHLGSWTEATHDPRILRCSLQHLGDLLLANQLPALQYRPQLTEAA